jgi:hypothetical protein
MVLAQTIKALLARTGDVRRLAAHRSPAQRLSPPV